MLLQPTSLYVEGLFNALKEDNKDLKFKEGKKWSTDIKTQTIEYNTADLKKFNFNEIKGLILHETGHLLHTREGKPTELEQKYPDLHTVYNAVEDVRIEGKMINQYGEFARQGITAVNDTMLESLSQKLIDDPQGMPELAQVICGITANMSYSRGQTSNTNAMYRLQGSTQKIHDKISRALTNMKYAIPTSTEDVKQIVDKYIYPEIAEYLEEGKKQLSSTMCKSDDDILKGSLKADKLNLNEENLPSDNELELLLAPYINTLSRKLQNVLKERAEVKYYGNHKSGRLLARNAYRVLIPNETRIFSKRNTPDIPNYTITLLLDESGSMEDQRNGTSKHATTYIGTYLLYRACQKLKFNINVIGYEDQPHNYDGLLNPYRRLRGGGNNEVEALKEAYKSINKNDDNLVFLLTDGMACVSKESIHAQINRLKKDKNADTVAIGIELQSNEVAAMKDYYPKSVNASKSEELPQVLISLISGMIHR